MELVRIYESLCDVTRLRLVHLLVQGPLCVCHFQDVLAEPQVKISKHLAYLRARALVEVERDGQWMVYRLPEKPSAPFAANIRCLQECAANNPQLQKDLARLKRTDLSCGPVRHAPGKTKTRRCAC